MSGTPPRHEMIALSGKIGFYNLARSGRGEFV